MYDDPLALDSAYVVSFGSGNLSGRIAKQNIDLVRT